MPLSSHGNRGLSRKGPQAPLSSHGRVGPPSSHGGQLRLRTPNFGHNTGSYQPKQQYGSRRNKIGWAYR